MTLSVVLAGGGSAGHIEPALAIADALRRDDPSVRITALGTARGLETRLVPERGYDLRLIPAVPLPRRPDRALLTLPGRLLGTVRAAAEVLDDVQADVLVGLGGYVALPGYLAARRRKVAIVVHEQNARPGLANRIGARLTTHVLTSSPASDLRHQTLVGVPLRPSVAHADLAALRPGAREQFGLPADGPVLMVTGGSQGARSVNTAVLGAAHRLLEAGIAVLHVTGRGNFESVRQQVDEIGLVDDPRYRVVGYVDGMQSAYAAGDLVLCRSGAGTVAELCAVGLPAVYVPLPIGNGEQRVNAEPVVQAGGGILVDDAQLTPGLLVATVTPLLADAERLGRMAAVAKSHGHAGADEAVAAVVRAAAGHPAPSGSTLEQEGTR